MEKRRNDHQKGDGAVKKRVLLIESALCAVAILLNGGAMGQDVEAAASGAQARQTVGAAHRPRPVLLAQRDATAPDGGPSLVNPGPAASPAQKARYRANRSRRRVIREARSFAGASSAAASLDVLGNSATPASLPPGTLDLGNGINMVLNYTGQFATNPSGGIRQGSAYAGQIAFGLDADLGRLAGIEGGSVHTVVTQRHGRSLARSLIV